MTSDEAEQDAEGQGPAEVNVPPTSTTGAPRVRARVGSWFIRQGDDLLRDALIGLVALLVGIAAAFWWDGRIADRQDQLARDLATASEIQENTRFVRQVVIDDAVLKPFSRLNLSGAALGGLDLGCEGPTADPPTGCADLAGADLSRAELFQANLTGADLGEAKLTDADLVDASLGDAYLELADLRGARLGLADLRGADLNGADLRGADLAGADLTGADLSGVCFDHRTTWTDGFTPPPSTCPPVVTITP